jgi:hypothetical protein
LLPFGLRFLDFCDTGENGREDPKIQLMTHIHIHIHTVADIRPPLCCRLPNTIVSDDRLTMRSLLLAFALSHSSRILKPIRSVRTVMSATTGSKKGLVIDPFCFRQFAENDASSQYGGTIFKTTMAEFEEIVNARFDESLLKEGYAPFCKHLFIVNDFTDAEVNVLPITPENEGLLRTKYDARNDLELPVLARFFPKEAVADNLPVAKYIDLILYSRDQINNENAAQKQAKDKEDAPWGIVSIKAQGVDYELPMNPITAMRNALGEEEGGSGIPIDRKAYQEAVDYWKDHAVIS